MLIPVTSTIDMPAFINCQAEGAFVVDVREPAEYVEGHVPGAVMAPMSRISQHLASLPRNRDVYVICHSGNRSRAMADLMVAAGINARSVNGGTAGWVAAGKPVVTGPQPD